MDQLATWLVLLGFVILAYFLPFYMFRRAVFQVIGIFRKSSSGCKQTPKTLDELGLRLPNYQESVLKPSDNLPYALKALIEADMVRLDDKGKACLAEEKIPAPRWGTPR